MLWWKYLETFLKDILNLKKKTSSRADKVASRKFHIALSNRLIREWERTQERTVKEHKLGFRPLIKNKLKASQGWSFTSLKNISCNVFFNKVERSLQKLEIVNYSFLLSLFCWFYNLINLRFCFKDCRE